MLLRLYVEDHSLGGGARENFLDALNRNQNVFYSMRPEALRLGIVLSSQCEVTGNKDKGTPSVIFVSSYASKLTVRIAHPLLSMAKFLESEFSLFDISYLAYAHQKWQHWCNEKEDTICEIYQQPSCECGFPHKGHQTVTIAIAA
ncbi:hypothetical protein SELMODRAFT_420364 [Selaginella moellendorffii]|uniref:Uncharacterized protein n=1 Tax=Selaginella moellendorffii TaxID=88036 RepID=D8SBR8_SELML|nr:hypothetical protein SELMODRAFT_420364 [Selaginella moellendorffii]